jgi:N-acetylglucosaminyldiphosphoundecaprenol N-acetyl-beta-D-mannosaminyltransferase
MEISCRHNFIRFHLLGVTVDALTQSGLFAIICDAVDKKTKLLIGNHNLHSLYLFKRFKALRAYYERVDFIEIDSMPMIAWAKVLGHKVARENRITYLDYRHDFWTLALQNGWVVFHVGGHPDTVAPARASLLARYPQLRLHLHTGYFDVNGDENQRLLAEISAVAPDILFVGMGMPRQELWISDNYDALPDTVILPVGAAFDYEAGAQYEPPRWTGRWGIEWLVRFIYDPKRLFVRYFYEPWFLLPAALGDIWQRIFRRSLLS